MVVAPLLIIGAVAVGLFIFKDAITNFFSLGIGSISDSFKGAGEFIAEGAGDIASAVEKPFGTVTTTIFEAGANLGRAEAARQNAEAIARAERDIEKAAMDAGFSSVEAFNMATDSGAVVIGGERTIVDFGLIGDVFPTDPSPEFIKAHPEFFETRGQTRFGGQSKILN